MKCESHFEPHFLYLALSFSDSSSLRIFALFAEAGTYGHPPHGRTAQRNSIKKGGAAPRHMPLLSLFCSRIDPGEVYHPCGVLLISLRNRFRQAKCFHFQNTRNTFFRKAKYKRHSLAYCCFRIRRHRFRRWPKYTFRFPAAYYP